MFFSIIHALIPNFYVLFSIVYSLFFVLGELSGFYTPFSVFYNKRGGFTGFFFSCFFATCRVFHPFLCFLQQRGWVYRLFLFLLLRNLLGFPPLSLFSTTMYRPPKVRPKNLTIGGRYFYGKIQL